MPAGAKQAALFPYARVTILCAFGLFAAYLAVFALTVADATVFDLVYWSLANGMPPVMLGWLVAMLLVPALPKP